MPIYDYECRGCGHQFELIVLRTTQVECPECKSRELEQLPSGFAVSTEQMTKARVRSARRQFTNGRNYRDQKVAEAEEVREHSPAYQATPKPK
jgi:putative FmdB family regulatory protein